MNLVKTRFKKYIKKLLNKLGYDLINISYLKKLELHYSGLKSQFLLGLKRFPISSIIDIGANTGQFAQFISKIFPDSHIYSFEPLPEAFQALKEWARLQHGKVSAFNIAIGDKKGEFDFYNHVEDSRTSTFLKTTELFKEKYPQGKKQALLKVKMTTLDDFIANLSNPLVPEILVKIDTEGYENHIIKGGIKTLTRAKACILEIHIEELFDGQATFKEIFYLLDNLGFRYVGNLNQGYIMSDGRVVSIDAVFVK